MKSTCLVGYTLIEVMIALMVFVILSATTSYILFNAFDTRTRVNQQANQLNELQLAILLMETDVQQLVVRAIHGNEMHIFSPFIGRANYVEFTHGGVVNPNGLSKRSTLRRVAYLCENQKLIRRSWEQLDIPARAYMRDKIILSFLDDCKFSYLSKNHQTLEEWRDYSLQDNPENETLPLAIQLTLTIHGWGNMSLYFSIPGVLYAG